MTEDELKAIEARANAATPGPWTAHRQNHCANMNCHEIEIREKNGGGLFRSTSYGTMEEDGEFIVHARTDIPALIAEVRTLRKHIAAHLKVESNLIDELDENEATQAVSTMNHNQIYETYKRTREALRDAGVHFSFLKNHYPCIGINLAHVDGNCVHCLALFGESKARKALGEE